MNIITLEENQANGRKNDLDLKKKSRFTFNNRQNLLFFSEIQIL